jgi:hypothetical protein
MKLQVFMKINKAFGSVFWREQAVTMESHFNYITDKVGING